MTARSMTAMFALSCACTGALLACSSDGDNGSAATEPAPSAPATQATAAETTAAETTTPAEVATTTIAETTTTAEETTTTAAAEPTWHQVFPGGDCQCADASEYSFYVREADPTKVVFFFQGGGACFNAATCDPASGTYKVTTSIGDAPSRNPHGIFDFDNELNPFRDYSFVFVPYCTADVFLGDTETEYAPDLVIQHKGYVNGNAALDELAATFPDAADVFVTGESAGAIPTPLFAGLVSDRLPDSRITVLADGSGAYPDVPAFNEPIGTAWGTANAIPDWPENAGMTVGQWSFPRLFIQSGHHDPDIVFARHDYAHDQVQTLFIGFAGLPSDDLLALIDQNETQIEQSGVNLLSFIAPGDSHTILGNDGFYDEQVNGVLLVDWVTALAKGETVTDEHCEECGP